jgi:hypothetical protein
MSGADPFENGYDPANVERIYRNRLKAQAARIGQLEAALEWYAEHGGKRARNALALPCAALPPWGDDPDESCPFCNARRNEPCGLEAEHANLEAK